VNETIRICLGPECAQCGGPELLQQLHDLDIPVKRCHCQGLCHEAPIAFIGTRCMAAADFETLIRRIVSQQGHKSLPSPPGICDNRP